MNWCYHFCVKRNTCLVFSAVFFFWPKWGCPAKKKNTFCSGKMAPQIPNLYSLRFSMIFCSPLTCFYFLFFYFLFIFIFCCIFELNLVIFLCLFLTNFCSNRSAMFFSFLCTVNILYKSLMRFMVCLCVLAVRRMFVFGHRKIGWCVVDFANEGINSSSILTCCRL